MYAFNWALTAFRSESYIGSATSLPDTKLYIITGATLALILERSFNYKFYVILHT